MLRRRKGNEGVDVPGERGDIHGEGDSGGRLARGAAKAQEL